MSLRDLLVHVDNSDAAECRIDVALNLAKAFDAHLTGIAVKLSPHLPVYSAATVPADLLAEVERNEEAAVAAARGRFEAKLAEAGRNERGGWTQGRGMPAEVLSARARLADLLVLSQCLPNGEYSGLADDVAMQSGRPVLVVPHIGVLRELGKNVLIGWNGGREAARAIADALPILRRADQVDVLSVGLNGQGESVGQAMVDHLLRHGVKARARQFDTKEIEVADAMLNYVSDHGADLVVMGAYGHSRMRELVLGGATRDMLKHMTVPVLMTH